MATKYTIDGTELSYDGIVWPTAEQMIGDYLRTRGLPYHASHRQAYRLTKHHQPPTLQKQNVGTITETTEYRPQATVLFKTGEAFTIAFWGREYA